MAEQTSFLEKSNVNVCEVEMYKNSNQLTVAAGEYHNFGDSALNYCGLIFLSGRSSNHVHRNRNPQFNKRGIYRTSRVQENAPGIA